MRRGRINIGPVRSDELQRARRVAEVLARRYGYIRWTEQQLGELIQSKEARLLGARRGDELVGVVAFENLPWDSDILGSAVGRVTLLGADEAEGESLAGRLLERARAEAASELEALWLRIAATHREGVRAAERVRAQLMACLSTLRFELEEGRAPRLPPGGNHVRQATRDDVRRLREIAAGAFTLDRYHRDPLLSPQRVNSLWEASVENAVGGRAWEVLVAEIRGRVEGFVTLHLEKHLSGGSLPGTGVIGLIAVSGGAARHGLGQALVGTALRRFADTACDAVEVGTQGDNLPALNLYLRTGFRLHRLWLDYRLKLPGKGPRKRVK